MRKRAEFQRIQGSGARVNTERFVLIIAPQLTTPGPTRLGITASRHIGGAVARNRAKRLVRAAFRATAELFPSGLDLVVIVRKALGDRRLAEVVEEWRAAKSAIARRATAALAELAARGNTPT